MTAENLDEISSFNESSCSVADIFLSREARLGFSLVVEARRLSSAVRAFCRFCWLSTTESAEEEEEEEKADEGEVEGESMVIPAVSRSFCFASGRSDSTSCDNRSRDLSKIV